jgi:hypothetical protein
MRSLKLRIDISQENGRNVAIAGPYWTGHAN